MENPYSNRESIFRLARDIERYVMMYATTMDAHGVEMIAEPKWCQTEALVSASTVSSDKCPKRVAAARWGFASSEFSENKLYEFALAHYAAMMAKVAIRRGVNAEHGDEDWFVYTEFGMERGELAGRADVLIRIPGPQLLIPVEIKRTDADFHSGLYTYSVWQTIIYMTLFRSPGGILLTLYSGKRNALKAWSIYEEPDGSGWRVYDGLVPMEPGDDEEIPVDENGVNFFSRAKLESMIDSYREWSAFYQAHRVAANGALIVYSDNQTMSLNDKAGLPEGVSPLKRPCCGKYKPMKQRQRNDRWGSAGDPLPGTGEASELCPLFNVCWKDKLEAGGVSTDTPIELLHVDEFGSFFEEK